MGENKMFLLPLLVLSVWVMCVSGQDTGEELPYQMMTNAAGGPERARCINPGNCYQVLLTCPSRCPTRSRIAPGNSACYISCSTCRATCRHRKVDCFGYGSVCYDPRFVGGDGVMFYFHGKKDQDFCLVSDRRVHINAHFIGKRPEGRPRDYTWVQSLGMVFGAHKLSIGARKVAKWAEEIDQLYMTFDGEDVSIPTGEGFLWTSHAGDVVVERTAKTNSVHLIINQLLEVSLRVVPITEEESRVHNYQIKDDDCFAHLQMQFNFFGLSSTVNGVLGQTYQPGFKTPVKVGVPMPVMGGDAKYLSSSLLSSDCEVTQFSQTSGIELDAEPLETFRVNCNSGRRGGLTCRR